MSDAAIILLILAGALYVYQIHLFATANSMLSKGYRNVRVGLGAGLMGIILSIVAVVVK